LNPQGIVHKKNCTIEEAIEHMPRIAQENAKKWANIQTISGGQLNTGKCFFYAFQKTINYKSNKISCSDIPLQTAISIQHKETSATTVIQQVSASEGRRTIGAILSPDGSSSAQLKLSLQCSRELQGKLRNAGLSLREQWIAITMVIEPAITYPLMTCLFHLNDLQKIDSILSKMKCSALGLNKNFSRAVLHGPPELGGIGIPSTQQKIIKDRINYFLYSMKIKTNDYIKCT